MTYSRLQNPTVQMLEERIALMEGAEACRAQASGMAAMTTALLCQLSAGDHIVAARAAFGSCRWLVDNLCPRFGIEYDRRSTGATMPRGKPRSGPTPRCSSSRPRPTRRWTSSISATSAALARAHGITTVVDNAFATAALQRPLELGADVVAYSATKLMDGQGRVLAGAVCGSEEFIHDKLLPFQRNTGPDLVAVQRLGGAEGAGNARPARPPAERERAQDRPIRRRAACRGCSTPASPATRSTSWRCAR